jgi:hypothetical protein
MCQDNAVFAHCGLGESEMLPLSVKSSVWDWFAAFTELEARSFMNGPEQESYVDNCRNL